MNDQGPNHPMKPHDHERRQEQGRQGREHDHGRRGAQQPGSGDRIEHSAREWKRAFDDALHELRVELIKKRTSSSPRWISSGAWPT